MTKDLTLVVTTAAIAVATFLVGSGQYVLGVVVLLAVVFLVVAAHLAETKINSRFWERADADGDYEEEAA